jgi:hypothetical protein
LSEGLFNVKKGRFKANALSAKTENPSTNVETVFNEFFRVILIKTPLPPRASIKNLG